MKTAALFGVLFAVLLGIGALLSSGTGSPTFIWVFLFIGLAATAYSFWNADMPASRAIRAVPSPNPGREEPPQ